MKKSMKRFLAMALCVLMFASIMPLTAFAATAQPVAQTYTIKADLSNCKIRPSNKTTYVSEYPDVNLKLYEGDTIRLSVDALGYGLRYEKGYTYQWYGYKASSSSSSYKKIKGATKPTLDVKVTLDSQYDRYYVAVHPKTWPKNDWYLTEDFVFQTVNPINYYAMVVYETYSGTDNYLPGDLDAAKMSDLLGSVKTPSGGTWNRAFYKDLGASDIINKILSYQNTTDYNDVFLFYYSGHGDPSSYDEYNGSLYCTDRNSLTLQNLASALYVVPSGRVFVMLDSCGSGAAVLPNGKKAQKDAQKFNQAVINAFAQAEGRGTAASNLGSFVNKFYVLASSSWQDSSYYHYSSSGNTEASHFTYWLWKGARPNSSGKMAADKNKNKALTLDEIYKYIKKYDKADYPQYVQVYPEKSSVVIFKS